MRISAGSDRRILQAPHALYCMRLVRGCPDAARRGEEYGELSKESFAAEDEEDDERCGILFGGHVRDR